MKIYDYSIFFSIDKASVSENSQNTKTKNAEETFGSSFQNCLSDSMFRLQSEPVDMEALPMDTGIVEEEGTSYLNQLSEELMNTSSGRKVIASMMENQIMGIVTGSENEETKETLQSILLGNDASDTISNLEKTLSSLQSSEK